MYAFRSPVTTRDDPMILVVTGAGGFIGRALVGAALAEGHRVRAVLRVNGQVPIRHPDLSVHAVGLCHRQELVECLRGADVVVHAAAALSGDFERQHTDTVVATRHLLGAMHEAGVARLVGISSFSVYDHGALADGTVLDERSPLGPATPDRPIYANAKIEQERLFRDFGATVLRPGIVYSRDRLWNFALGRALGSRTWLLLGPDTEVPLVHVDDVAQAILLAARIPPVVDAPINLVEDAPPCRWQLIDALNRTTVLPRRIVRLPWPLHRRLAVLIGAANRGLFAGKLKLPGLLDPVRAEAAFKPLRYDNRRARDVLGWRPTRHAGTSMSAPVAAEGRFVEERAIPRTPRPGCSS
jgi:nucleoside-diphosphate-sugar epimerase